MHIGRVIHELRIKFEIFFDHIKIDVIFVCKIIIEDFIDIINFLVGNIEYLFVLKLSFKNSLNDIIVGMTYGAYEYLPRLLDSVISLTAVKLNIHKEKP